jgi:hypothetical protein
MKDLLNCLKHHTEGIIGMQFFLGSQGVKVDLLYGSERDVYAVSCANFSRLL